MTKKKILLFIVAVCVIALVGFTQKTSSQKLDTNISFTANTNSEWDTASKNERIAEKIEVLHFHGTQQCWSCSTIGKYALKIIEERFSEEYKNGTIVFRDINGELPENKEIVTKFQARGSSLYINAIANGKDSIEEDVTVWRLVSNEQKFTEYFENKLKSLLGK